MADDCGKVGNNQAGGCQNQYQVQTPGGGEGGAAPMALKADGGDIEGGGPSLEEHVNAILGDGRDHGFPDGYNSFVPRVTDAMKNAREKGIVTSDDPKVAMQQISDWLMDNSGSDKTFSFGGGPNGEDDAAALEAKSGMSRGDINALKFMFDTKHDAQLTNEDQLQVNNSRVFNELAALFI